MSDDGQRDIERLVRQALSHYGTNAGGAAPTALNIFIGNEFRFTNPERERPDEIRSRNPEGLDMSPAAIVRILLTVSETINKQEKPMQDFPGFEDAGALAAWTAGILGTYAGAAGRKVLAELSDRAADAADAAAGKLCEKAGDLWDWLKARLSGDPVRRGQLEAFEQAPQARADALGALLSQHLESDEDFRSAIKPLLKQLAELHAQMPRQTTHGQQIAIGQNIRQIQGDGNTQL